MRIAQKFLKIWTNIALVSYNDVSQKKKRVTRSGITHIPYPLAESFADYFGWTKVISLFVCFYGQRLSHHTCSYHFIYCYFRVYRYACRCRRQQESVRYCFDIFILFRLKSIKNCFLGFRLYYQMFLKVSSNLVLCFLQLCFL